MKKHYLLCILLFSSFYTGSYACEICGCANSNLQIGLLPNFNKGFLGFRYSYSNFSSQVRDEPSEFSHDSYQTMELWGGYNLKKFQIMTFVPYVVSRKESDDGVAKTNGLGDWMVLVNYKVLNSSSQRNDSERSVTNEMFVGGGVKLPTGESQVNPNDPEFNIGDFNSQAGTGSVDFILNATHNLNWNKNGIVTNVAYRINSTNDEGYRFGNRAYVSSSYYYTFTKSNTKLMPNAGINFQSNAINTFDGDEVEDSDGYNFNSIIGLNVVQNKLGFNALVFIPVAQNNYDGQTKLKSRVVVGVTYSF